MAGSSLSPHNPILVLLVPHPRPSYFDAWGADPTDREFKPIAKKMNVLAAFLRITY
jgi:hypothetical protein